MKNNSICTQEDVKRAEEFMGRLEFMSARIEARAEHIAVLQALKLASRTAGPEDAGDLEKMIGDASEELHKDVAAAVNADGEIRGVISCVEDLRLRTLLELRYTACMTWEDVAERMGYDVRSVYRLRNAAIEKVAEVLKSCQ